MNILHAKVGFAILVYRERERWGYDRVKYDGSNADGEGLVLASCVWGRAGPCTSDLGKPSLEMVGLCVGREMVDLVVLAFSLWTLPY
jgi:hypothetical protein